MNPASLHAYELSSFGARATKFTLVDLKLSDYVRFLTFDGNDAAPVRFVDQASWLGLAQAVSFSYINPGLGQRVYGVKPDGTASLLAYVVDSSD